MEVTHLSGTCVTSAVFIAYHVVSAQARIVRAASENTFQAELLHCLARDCIDACMQEWLLGQGAPVWTLAVTCWLAGPSQGIPSQQAPKRQQRRTAEWQDVRQYH